MPAVESTQPKQSRRILRRVAWGITFIGGIIGLIWKIHLTGRPYAYGLSFNRIDFDFLVKDLLPIFCMVLLVPIGILLQISLCWRSLSDLRWLVLSLLLIGSWWVPGWFPARTFQEGMRDRVRRDIPEERLLKLASDVRDGTLKSSGKSGTSSSFFEEDFDMVKLPYPEIYALNPDSHFDISTTASQVKLVWSIRNSHWGICIHDQGPPEITNGLPVYPKVSVFKMAY